MNHYDEYKKFKKLLIFKYKKKLSRTPSGQILDSFVSINDFLAVEMSKGPDESPGNIDYFYQETRNVYNFCKILVNHYGFNKILCIPKFVLKYKNFIDNTSIVFYEDVDELIVPVKLINKIQKCIDSNLRFIYFIFMIDNKSNNSNHANVIIIDLYKKTIERFEPHGNRNDKLEKKINNAIKIRLLKILELNNFTYISPLDISPKFGLQAKSDAYTGMCLTYSMLYLQLRLMNPDIIQKELVNYLLQMDHKKLRILVLKYAKFIEITLKKYEYQINENDEYLYDKWNDLQDYIISGSNKNIVTKL
jgi:hypothetical protein